MLNEATYFIIKTQKTNFHNLKLSFTSLKL